MTRARVGLLFAVFLLFGCDHRRPAAPSSAAADIPVAQPESASAYPGGPPIYPRATLVSLPPPPSTPALKPPPPPAAPATPPSTTSTSTAAVSVPSAALPAPPLDSTLPPAPGTPNGLPDGTNPDLSASETIPPTPSAPPPPVMDDDEAKKQVVVLATSLGRIVIQLDDIYAPRTCGNFRKLVSDGFYNHTTFHRVIPNFMIQGGDPNSRTDDRATYGQGDPGYTLPAEIKLKHVAGAVAMARLPDPVNPERDSNGSQFFICVATCPSLDDQYTVFGHVIEGLDVAVKIANQQRDSRDDPFSRIEMEATLEPKKQALEEDSAGQ
jgi:peptidyl-prolyl cis-trans isomerase B (cyclophilin B)